LALDYDRESFAPLSPRDYFPLGVGYIAVVFDYAVHSWTKLDWYIIGTDEKIEASGIASLNIGNGKKALIVQPEMGLGEGSYEFKLELNGKVVLAEQFEVFWNPTLWPITMGENAYQTGEVINISERFPFGTEVVFASYPTINFHVGDEIFAEWFVDGEKLGEHHYVWDNPDWSTGVHANVVDNQVESGKPLPIGNYELFVFVNDTPKQCKAFAIIDSSQSTNNTSLSGSVPGCETFEEATIVSSQGSWDRYQSRTLSELAVLTEELVAGLEEGNIYLEVSPDYQYPSRVPAIFMGSFQDTPELKLFVITTWMRTFAPNMTEDEVVELFSKEVLIREGTKEYWLPIQNSLIPIMEEELSAGDEIELLLVWIGAITEAENINRIYLVNAFE
jgi:hypothetical protein